MDLFDTCSIIIAASFMGMSFFAEAGDADLSFRLLLGVDKTPFTPSATSFGGGVL